MVNGRKEFAHVAFQSINSSCIIAAYLSKKMPQTVHGGMRTLSNAT